MIDDVSNESEAIIPEAVVSEPPVYYTAQQVLHFNADILADSVTPGAQ